IAIIAEAVLSFLGLGVQPPAPKLGHDAQRRAAVPRVGAVDGVVAGTRDLLADALVQPRGRRPPRPARPERLLRWGPRDGPHTPRRSARPGKPVTRLERLAKPWRPSITLHQSYPPRPNNQSGGWRRDRRTRCRAAYRRAAPAARARRASRRESHRRRDRRAESVSSAMRP